MTAEICLLERLKQKTFDVSYFIYVAYVQNYKIFVIF